MQRGMTTENHKITLLTYCSPTAGFTVMQLLWPPCVADADIIFWSCFFFLSFFLAYYQRSQIGCLGLPYFYIWCRNSANLECRSEMCRRRLAGNAGPKKSPKIRHLGTVAQIYRATSSQSRHVSTIGKRLLKQQYLPRRVLTI